MPMFERKFFHGSRFLNSSTRKDLFNEVFPLPGDVATSLAQTSGFGRRQADTAPCAFPILKERAKSSFEVKLQEVIDGTLPQVDVPGT